MKLRLILPIALLSSLSLISCGGGGGGGDDPAETLTYSGVTTAAKVTADNADQLAVAATAGAGQAIAENIAQDAAFKASPEQAFILDFSDRIKRYLSTANRTANQDISADFCSSGTADFTANEANTVITFVFNNCTTLEGDGEIVNGTVIVLNDDPETFSSFSMQFVSFSVTFAGETYTMNMTITCGGEPFSCTWTSDFTGPDGRTYRTQNAVVFFNGIGYDIIARIFDPDFGFIEIDGDVQIGHCSNGVPFPGSISFTGSEGSSASVTYDSCEQFTVTVNGVPTTYFWADILL